MLLLSLREKIKESDGESVVVGITADMDNIPTIRSGSFNLMPAYGYRILKVHNLLESEVLNVPALQGVSIQSASCTEPTTPVPIRGMHHISTSQISGIRVNLDIWTLTSLHCNLKHSLFKGLSWFRFPIRSISSKSSLLIPRQRPRLDDVMNHRERRRSPETNDQLTAILAPVGRESR
eukprot:scaffold10560_cov272-Chaetoceros_neogracile.AAC.4